jgi:polar amino acid transport system substrate-binding protein
MNILGWRHIPSLFFLLILSFPVYAREFTIIASPQSPHKFTENGVIKGIDVEVISHVMDRLDIKYKIKLIKSASRIIHEIKSGRADMVLLFSQKNSRLDYLIYPKEKYIDISWNFFILKENAESIIYNNFEDLKGLKVGITKDISYTSEFINSSLAFDYVSQNTLQIKKLLAKRIDTVPLNTISTLYEAKKKGYSNRLAYLPKPLKFKPYYNVFSIASQHPVIAKYDQIIRELKQEQIITGILDKYLISNLL